MLLMERLCMGEGREHMLYLYLPQCCCNPKIVLGTIKAIKKTSLTVMNLHAFEFVSI
jgi:hypothetical protein